MLLRRARHSLASLRRKLRLSSRASGNARDVDPAAKDGGTRASLLCVEPTIIGSWPLVGFPLGVATAIGERLHSHPVEFLMFPAWAWELPDIAQPILSLAAAHRAAHPRNKFSFLCNAPAQESQFAAAGWPTTTLNRNMFCDEARFHPMPETEPLYEAVYNARLAPYKRFELAADVDRLCIIHYYLAADYSVEAFHAEQARISACLPKATFLNRLTPYGCEFLAPTAVNLVLNQSKVGLCLSAVEGQMRASMEYMMAGLPIVSTPSIGGRDYFFDDEFCAIADPDPRSIREAVTAMAARRIPRDHIRARTLARVERERSRFVDFVQGVIERHGGRTDFASAFPGLLHGDRLVPWVPSARAFGLKVQEAVNASDASLSA